MAKVNANYELMLIINPALGEEGIASVVERFNSTPDLPAEVERIANITDGVIRSLVVCKDE